MSPATRMKRGGPKRGGPRGGEAKRGGVSSIQDALGAFLRQSGLAGRLGDRRVLDAWSTAVGPALAERARPVRFQDGDLVVEVESTAHLHELKNFTGEQHRQAANERLMALGFRPTIRRVTFKIKR